MTKTSKPALGEFRFATSCFTPPQEQEKEKPELNEHQLASKEMMKQYNDAMFTAFDSEFWCTFCFPSQNSMEAFMRRFAVDLHVLGNGKYIDGGKLRKHLRAVLKKGVQE